MALLWIEGYEGYGTATGTNINTYMCRRYPTRDLSSHWYIQNGRYGGFCGRGNGNYYAGTPALTTCDTVVFGCAYIRVQNNSMSSTQYFMTLMDGATVGVRCAVNDYTGEIDVYRNATLLGSTSGAMIPFSNWVFIEIKVKCHDTEGAVDIRVNGVNKLSLSGIDTKNGTHSYHDILRIYLSTYHYLDDIYLLDATGTMNNDFLGNVRVVGIFPEGDTATLQWTPSSGTAHYDLVDETRDNDDTDYVDGSTSGQVDLWEYGSTSGLDAIAGIQVNTTIKRTDASAFTLIVPVKSDETTSEDAGQSAAASYDAKVRVLETDPDTGAAWTQDAINALQCGVKVA